MNRWSWAVLHIALVVSLPLASTAQHEHPQFDVATIKPADPKNRAIALFTYPGGRISATHYTLRQLIHEAFQLEDYQIDGGPSWLDDAQWDIQAKPPEGSEASKANPASPKSPMTTAQCEMLQELLIERFGLKFHKTAKDMPVYRLKLGSRDPNIEPTTHPQEFSWTNLSSGALKGTNVTMAAVASRLASLLHRRVVDETQLTGHYDFSADYAGNTWKQGDEPDDAIYSSLKWLGLKLESGRLPVEMLMVDSASKPSVD